MRLCGNIIATNSSKVKLESIQRGWERYTWFLSLKRGCFHERGSNLGNVLCLYRHGLINVVLFVRFY